MVAMLRYENVWLQKQRFEDAERVFYENKFSVSEPAETVRKDGPVNKMAATLQYENVWLQRQRFEDAERVFYENMFNASRPSAVVQANVRIEAPAATVSNSSNVVNESSPLKNIEDQIANFKEIILDLQSKINAVGARVKKMEDRLGVGAAPAQPTQTKPAQVASKEEDDDDVDLFGSDSEEDEAASEARKKLLDAYAAKKAKKPVLIAKSNIILDIKPWDDETDMKQMETEVRKISIEGLLWGAAKLVPLAFGIHKLQISCVVEDELVSVDLLQEQIEALEDYVQSVDIAAFNKV